MSPEITNPSIVIDYAKDADFPAIIELVKELALFEKAPEAVTVTPEEYLEDWKKGFFQIRLAKMNDEIIGMALYYNAYSSWKGRMLYLDDLIVTEKHRGLGAGALLLNAVIDEARKLNARLVKWQVLDWNTNAIDFYKMKGAEIEEGWWNVKYWL